jgi:hypothetical protein
MSYRAVPPEDAVQRGFRIVERELERSLILPRPASCIRRILKLIDSAHNVLTELSAVDRHGNPATDDFAEAAGVAVSLVAGCRQALADLVRPGQRAEHTKCLVLTIK